MLNLKRKLYSVFLFISSITPVKVCNAYGTNLISTSLFAPGETSMNYGATKRESVSIAGSSKWKSIWKRCIVFSQLYAGIMNDVVLYATTS